MMTQARNFVKKLIKDYREKRMYRVYNAQWLRYMSKHGFANVHVDGEDEYVAYWKQISKYVSPLDYRYFSHFKIGLGGVISIPENVGHTIIEAALNPSKYTPLYLDKNMFPKFVGKDNCPRTLLCRINGSSILDEDFRYWDGDLSEKLNEIDVVVLKPSVDSCSGHGVQAFRRDKGGYYNETVKLTKDYLLQYGKDFVLQEGIKQSEYMKQFNPTSVNTIRLYVYKSVKDDMCHVVGGVLRIGGKGSFLDNAHAGGRFVAIDMNSGELGKMTFNTEGFSSIEHNGIDFSSNEFAIPNWSTVKFFAKNIVSLLPHMRYVGLDIALDNRNKPVLIEYNCGDGYNMSGAGFWVLLYTGQHPFGDYSDEIVEYCKTINKHA